MKKIILFILLFTAFAGFSQTNPPAKQVIYPVVYIDNVKSDVKQMHKLPPDDITEVSVLKGQEAIDKIGADGKYGVIYVQTKSFVRNQNWKFLSSKSPEYAQAVTSPNEMTNVQYIYNGRPLNSNIEKTLGGLNDKNFRSVMIISQEDLKKQYRIADKKYGVIILSDPRYHE